MTLTLKAIVGGGGPAAADRRPLPETSPRTRAPTTHSGLLAAGWVGIGVGVAGLVAGTVFVIKNHSDRNDANGALRPQRVPGVEALGDRVVRQRRQLGVDPLVGLLRRGGGRAGHRRRAPLGGPRQARRRRRPVR